MGATRPALPWLWSLDHCSRRLRVEGLTAAARCRRSESRSTPKLAAELVRKYATAGVRVLAMH